MFLKVVVTDVERAGKATLHFIEHIPSAIEHGVRDVFGLIAKDVSPAALKAAVGLAEHYVGTILPQARGLVEGTVVKLADPVEHTVAFEWVKGELIKTGVLRADQVPDAHTLASMAWALVNRGITLVDAHITADETQALAEAAAAKS